MNHGSYRSHTEHELPFERLSPRDFERLCLGLVQRLGYEDAQHLGAAGGEQGRDITALREGRRVVFQCKRVRDFARADAEKELDKLLALPDTMRPTEVIFLVTCDVSARTREKAAERAGSIPCRFYALTELDQLVRGHPSLVEQFFGITTPAVPAPIGAVGVPPKLPPHYQERSAYLDDLKRKILSRPHMPLAITGSGTVGIQGMGGIGKSVLAAAVAQNPEVRAAFPDGILWVTVGRNVDHLAVLRELAAAVRLTDTNSDSTTQLRGRIRRQVEKRRILLVLDDVWTFADADALDVIGPDGRILLTTRDAGILTSLGAEERAIGVTVLEREDARHLLAAWAGQDAFHLPAVVDSVAEECGFLPLALAMAGALARRVGGWGDVLERLRQADLERLETLFPGYPYPNLLRSLEVSVEALDAVEAERYLELAVFPEDAEIPESAVFTLWSAAGLGAKPARDLILQLALLSLLRVGTDGRLALHDLQGDYLRRRAGDLRALHCRLIDAYATGCPDGLATGPNDGWFFQRLPWHFVESGREDELRGLLLSFSWLLAKLEATDISALIADFDCLRGDPDIQHLQATLRLSAHVVAHAPQQLAGQLLGRLSEEDAPSLGHLIASARTGPGGPWLRPLTPTLSRPGVRLGSVETLPLIRAMETLDEHRVLLRSIEGLAVLDLETGELSMKLSGEVLGMAVLDPWTVVALSWRSFQILDLRTGKAVERKRTISLGRIFFRWLCRIIVLLPRLGLRQAAIAARPRESREWPAASLEGGRLAVAGDDAVLCVFDLKSDRILRRLATRVDIVSLAALGGRYLAASVQRTVQIWDTETGRLVRSLPAPDGVPAYHLAARGSLLAMAGQFEKCRPHIWDWQTGTLLGELGEARYINKIAWLGERRLVVAKTNSIEVWDVPECKLLRRLETPSSITAFLAGLTGSLLVSGGIDGILSLWDVEKLDLAPPATPHKHSVTDVALLTGGRAASLGMFDNVFKLWDTATGQLLQGVEIGTEAANIAAELLTVGIGGGALISTQDGSLTTFSDQLLVWEPDGTGPRNIPIERPGVYLAPLGPFHVALITKDPSTTDHLWEATCNLFAVDLRSGTCSPIMKLPSVPRSIVWTGRQLVAVSLYGSLLLLNVKEAREETLHLGMGYIESIAPLGGERLALSGERNKLAVVDLESKTIIREWSDGSIFKGKLAPIGKGLFVQWGGGSHSLHLWDSRTAKLLATFTCDAAVTALVGAPGSPNLVVGDQSGVVHFLILEQPENSAVPSD